MTLLNELSGIAEYPHFKPIFLRLSVMEAVAAIKMMDKKPTHDPIREAIILDGLRVQCLNLNFIEDHITFIQLFFTELKTLSKLIQEACMQEWQGKSNDELLSYAITSIKEVTGKDSNKTNALLVIRDFIDRLTDEILRSDNTTLNAECYDTLRSILERYFISINKELLYPKRLELRCSA